MTYGSVWLLQSSTKTSDSQQSLKLAVYNEFAILESFASNSSVCLVIVKMYLVYVIYSRYKNSCKDTSP